jgi:phosphoribosyl-ATP pyrophosphohydrolase
MMKIDDLYQVICERRDHPVAQSYTARLIAAGEDEILKKIGEEAMEVLLAAKGQGKQRVIEEVADLAYHVLTLLAAQGITPDDIYTELDHRHKPQQG